MILLSKVVHFLQRSTLPDSVINNDTKIKVRESSAFLDLIRLIDLYQECLPPSAHEAVQPLANGRLDSNLLNARIVPHV